MTLTGDWLERAETQTLCALLNDAGYQALLVGGCVRNALLGVPVSDIDISTNARPAAVMALAQKAQFKVIPTGIEHGTVTVVVNGIAHEITTFRKDVETDGRRAVVAFADRVEEDARRRDFTMNALYVRADGQLVDPLGGLDDLQARRFRFIDDADQRIREDYLRILRYFRFHAWYGDPAAGMDSEALAAIAANSVGLETLSKERVGSEMRKLLAAPDPAPAVATMRQTGVLPVILPGSDDTALSPFVYLESQAGIAPDAIARLAALGGADVETALRLSSKEVAKFGLLRDLAAGVMGPAEMGYRHGKDSAISAMLLRTALLEVPLPADFIDDATRGSVAKFPVSAKDLMPEYQGPALGQKLRALETQWIKSGFTADAATLLR